MRNLFLSIALLAALPLVAQDRQVLSARDISGTARYVGMAGAMTAIGGDGTAAFDNPAGLGMYTGMEAQITLDIQSDRVRPVGATNWCNTRNYVIPSTATVVFSMTSKRKEVTSQSKTSVTLSDVPYARHGIMVGFRRLKNFNRSSATWAENEPYYNGYEWMRNGTVHNCDESGNVNDFCFAWGMTIKDKFSLGLGLDLISFRYTKDAQREYSEFFEAEYPEGTELPMSSDLYEEIRRTVLIQTGFGASAKIGFMARPIQWLSLGAAVHTPMISSLRQSDNFVKREIITWVDERGKEFVTDSTFDYGTDRVNRGGFYMPMRFNVGTAFHFGRFGELGLQYDLSYLKDTKSMHTLRAGLEIRPIEALAINAGYAYESPFCRPLMEVVKQDQYGNDYLALNDEKYILANERRDRNDDHRSDTDYRFANSAHHASLGIGWEGKWIFVRAAYQLRLQKYDVMPYMDRYLDPKDSNKDEITYYDTPHPLLAQTHRVVFTIGFRR